VGFPGEPDKDLDDLIAWPMEIRLTILVRLSICTPKDVISPWHARPCPRMLAQDRYDQLMSPRWTSLPKEPETHRPDASGVGSRKTWAATCLPVGPLPGPGGGRGHVCEHREFRAPASHRAVCSGSDQRRPGVRPVGKLRERSQSSNPKAGSPIWTPSKQRWRKTSIPHLDIGPGCGRHIFQRRKATAPLLMVLSARLCGYRGDYDKTFSTALEYLHAGHLCCMTTWWTGPPAAEQAGRAPQVGQLHCRAGGIFCSPGLFPFQLPRAARGSS